MMAQKMSKKMSFLGQKHEEKCMNILQWNAGGFLAQKWQIKKAINEEITHVLITNEANVTKENIQFYNTNGYTIYALYEGRRIASGILVAVKITLTSKLRVATEIKEGDNRNSHTCQMSWKGA